MKGLSLVLAVAGFVGAFILSGCSGCSQTGGDAGTSGAAVQCNPPTVNVGGQCVSCGAGTIAQNGQCVRQVSTQQVTTQSVLSTSGNN
ncbi:MAG: hypothetical protein HY403_06330 [Elusimicrobia bacterium]|nr:hypothetical protein [Elusimicrobiota bacterium]